MDDQEVRNRIVEKLLRKRVIGAKKHQFDTVVRYSVPTHEQGRARSLLREMIVDPTAPVEAYGGGHRENVRFTSAAAAVEYLNEFGGNVPFSFE